MSLRGAVEAALFAAGGPMHLNDLAQVVGSPTEEVESMLTVLRVEFKSREGGLEIVRHAGGLWVLQVPKQYTHLVTRLMPPDLEAPLMRTLSVIALLQPVTQAKVVDRRGQGAYTHIKELEKRMFVTREPAGNSFLLKTTPEFARRFRLKDDPEAIRTALKERAEISPDVPEIEAATEPLSQEALHVLAEAGEQAGVDAEALTRELTDALAPLSEQAGEMLDAPTISETMMSAPVEDSGTAAGDAEPVAVEATAQTRAVSRAMEEAAPAVGAGSGAEKPEGADANADAKVTRLADHSSLRQRMLHGNERTIFRIPRKARGA